MLIFGQNYAKHKLVHLCSNTENGPVKCIRNLSRSSSRTCWGKMHSLMRVSSVSGNNQGIFDYIKIGTFLQYEWRNESDRISKKNLFIRIRIFWQNFIPNNATSISVNFPAFIYDRVYCLHHAWNDSIKP